MGLKVVLGSFANALDVETDPRAPGGRRELIYGSSKISSLEHIISPCLPPKHELDRFLGIYFSGNSYIIPFVRSYHFQRQYKDFWADTARVHPLWLSI